MGKWSIFFLKKIPKKFKKTRLLLRNLEQFPPKFSEFFPFLQKSKKGWNFGKSRKCRFWHFSDKKSKIWENRKKHDFSIFWKKSTIWKKSPKIFANILWPNKFKTFFGRTFWKFKCFISLYCLILRPWNSTNRFISGATTRIYILWPGSSSGRRWAKNRLLKFS